VYIYIPFITFPLIKTTTSVYSITRRELKHVYYGCSIVVLYYQAQSVLKKITKAS